LTTTPAFIGLAAIGFFAAAFIGFFAALPFFIIAMIISYEGKAPSVSYDIFFIPPMQDE